MVIAKEIINHIQASSKPLIIGISGFGGAGKSSYAKIMSDTIDAALISVDSFQRDGAFDTDYSLWQIMDFMRLKREVLQPFVSGKLPIRYGHFSARAACITETREINSQRLVVEGVGLFRPELVDYLDVKIWVDCPIEIAYRRGRKRDRDHGMPADTQWDTIWKKNDEEYFSRYRPKELADFVINNSQ